MPQQHTRPRHGRRQPRFNQAGRSLHRGEDGQIAFTFIITILAVFVLLGFSLDAGLWYFDHRTAQNQADAAVLAAIHSLPEDPNQAILDAIDYLERNGVKPDEETGLYSHCTEDNSSPAIWTEFEQGFAFRVNGGQRDAIRVCVLRGSNSVFSALARLAKARIGAAAAAAVILEEAPQQFAIYANCQFATSQTFCIKLSGSGSSSNRIDVTGRVHSNRRIEVSGSFHRFNGPVTYGLTGSSFHSSTAYNSGSPPCPNPNLHCLAPDMPVPMPQPATWSDFHTGSGWRTPPCTQTFNSNRDISGTVSGVICVNGEITIKDNATSGPGGVTFVATGLIKMDGNNTRLSPNYNNVLLFSNRPMSSGDFAIEISGQGSRWEGVIMAPRAGVKFSGSNHRGNDGGAVPASIIADHVEMSGSDWDLQGIASSSDGGGDRTWSLVE